VPELSKENKEGRKHMSHKNGKKLAGKVAWSLGEIPIIHKPGVGHHPHGLDDPEAGCRFHLEARVASVTRQGYSFAQPSTMLHSPAQCDI
jgi:hypothetical protein